MSFVPSINASPSNALLGIFSTATQQADDTQAVQTLSESTPNQTSTFSQVLEQSSSSNRQPASRRFEDQQSSRVQALDTQSIEEQNNAVVNGDNEPDELQIAIAQPIIEQDNGNLVLTSVTSQPTVFTPQTVTEEDAGAHADDGEFSRKNQTDIEGVNPNGIRDDARQQQSQANSSGVQRAAEAESLQDLRHSLKTELGIRSDRNRQASRQAIGTQAVGDQAVDDQTIGDQTVGDQTVGNQAVIDQSVNDQATERHLVQPQRSLQDQVTDRGSSVLQQADGVTVEITNQQHLGVDVNVSTDANDALTDLGAQPSGQQYSVDPEVVSPQDTDEGIATNQPADTSPLVDSDLELLQQLLPRQASTPLGQLTESQLSRQQNSVDIAQQIAARSLSEAEVLNPGDSSRFRIRLDPPELGKLLVELHKTAQGTTVTVTAADPATQQLLRDSLQQLNQSHSDDAGIFETLDFDLATGDREGSHDQNRRKIQAEKIRIGRSQITEGSASTDTNADIKTSTKLDFVA